MKHSDRNFRNRKGAFTIIELLIVIAIVAILSALAANNYVKAQVRSHDSARKSSVNSIAGAVETYYSVEKKFPGDAYEPGTTRIPPASSDSPAYAYSCEDYSRMGAGGLSANAPYYFYKPNQNCSTGSKISETATQFAYDPADYSPAGTWIPGLGRYLNPFPSETHFINHLGTSTSDILPYDPIDATGFNFTPSLTLSYRNFKTGYLVYARLESDSDKDFTTQFSDTRTSGKACLPVIPGVVQPPPRLACVSEGKPPIILYLVRK